MLRFIVAMCVGFLIGGVFIAHYAGENWQQAVDAKSFTWMNVTYCITEAVEDAPTETPLIILMNVSAYCPCERCCGVFADGVTASGAPAVGYFVAAPPDYPFGTLMTVPGYADGRPVRVLDRGGAIKGNKLDVFFPTHQEALNWGRQYLEVELKGELL